MEVKSKQLPKREDLSSEYQWDLKVIYDSLDAWEADFNKLKAMIAEITQKETGFLDSAENLLELLQKKDELGRLLDKLFVYARMHKDENNANSTYQALSSRIQSLAVEASSSLSFIVPVLVHWSEESLEQYLKQVPELKLYQRFFSEIKRQKKHILSISEERLLAESGEIADAAGAVFGMLDNADIKFPEIIDENGEAVELTKGRYSRFLESKDRRVRHDAFKALYDTYAKYRNTLGATLNGAVKADVFYAKVRNFDSALQSSLDDDCIPVTVYDRLIEVVHKFLPSLHRYLKVRKQILNLPDLHMYDLYASLIPEYQREIPYEKAKELVLDALQPLGEEYCKLISQGFNEKWIDVYENMGKTSGVYAWGAYDTHPYILLNYQGKIHDVFTLAHEMGHALHSYYSNHNQPYIYSSYKIFVTEVASTVNEALLLNHMLAKSNEKQEKLYLINQWLEQFRTTVFRQTMFAEFEKIIHSEVENGGALTADFFGERYLELNKLYYGAETVIDDSIANEWSRIPHFYSAFYVYKYATGYSAATALSQMIIKEGAPARQKYLEFLRSGDIDHPLNLLRNAGVDMESSQPIEAALQVFDGLVSQMAELTGVKE